MSTTRFRGKSALALFAKEVREHSLLVLVFLGIAFASPMFSKLLGSRIAQEGYGFSIRSSSFMETLLYFLAPLLAGVVVFSREMDDRSDRFTAALPSRALSVWTVKVISGLAITGILITGTFLFFTLFFGPPPASGRAIIFALPGELKLWIPDEDLKVWETLLLAFPPLAFAFSIFIVQMVRQTVIGILLSFVGSLFLLFGLSKLPWGAFCLGVEDVLGVLSWVFFLFSLMAAGAFIHHRGRGLRRGMKDTILASAWILIVVPILLLSVVLAVVAVLSPVSPSGRYHVLRALPSPDGAHIAVSIHPSGRFGPRDSRVWLIDSEDGSVAKISDRFSSLSYRGSAWNPRTGAVYFASGSGLCGLFHVRRNRWYRFDPNSGRSESWNPPKALSGPVVTDRQGDVFYRIENGNLIWQRFGSQESRRTDLGVPQGSHPSAIRGSRVFFSGTSGRNTALTILDLDAGAQRRFDLDVRRNDSRMTISPDGRWILVRLSNQPANGGAILALLDVDTGKQRKLKTAGFWTAIFSPVEPVALLAQDRGLSFLNLETGNLAEIFLFSKLEIGERAYCRDGAWSPDGSTVAAVFGLMGPSGSSLFNDPKGITILRRDREEWQVREYGLPSRRSLKPHGLIWRSNRHLLFICYGEDYGLWELDIESGQVRRILPVD